MIVLMIKSPRFYRFVNQTRDPIEALHDNDGSHFHRQDLHPEIFFVMSRENVDVTL